MSDKIINLSAVFLTAFIAFLTWRFFDNTGAVVSLAICLFGLCSFLLVRGANREDAELSKIGRRIQEIESSVKKVEESINALPESQYDLNEIINGCLMSSDSMSYLTDTDESAIKCWVRRGILRGFELEGQFFIPAKVVVLALTDESGRFHPYDDFHKPLLVCDAKVASEKFDKLIDKLHDITGSAHNA